MKRRYADRAGWARVPEAVAEEHAYDLPEFRGHVVVVHLLQVREPLWITRHNRPDDRVCIADSGYIWITFLPQGQNYAVTQMVTEHDETVEWYIDICEPYERDTSGRLYYEDWYLDIVVFPDGSMQLLDEDEMEAALAASAITPAIYEAAYRERARLLVEIHAGRFPSDWMRAYYRTKEYT